MIATLIDGTVQAYSNVHIISFTITALVIMLTLVNCAVFAIRRLTRKIDSKIISLDDLALVAKTINFDMALVWPMLLIVVIQLFTMLFLIFTERIVLDVFRNGMILYLFGTIMLGIWSKVNESKLQTLKVDDPELAVVYKLMLKDWKKRWFRLHSMSSYSPEKEETVTRVKSITNYTEM